MRISELGVPVYSSLIRSAAFVIVVTQKLVLQQYKNVQRVQEFHPPPCILLAPIQATPQQKVQIVKTADVKIQVRGLLPGQQLVHMPDGKLSADNSLRCCKIPAVAVSKNCIQRENVRNQGRIQGGVAPPP